jgi:hypothetical protein
MKHHLVRCISILTIVAVAGCAPRTDKMEPAPGTYAAPGELKFSIKITPARFAVGEPVSLEASLFNGGHDAFEKHFASGCQWDFEVSTENGRVVAPSRMCTMAESELRLEPGELRMILRDWEGSDDYFGASEPLPPGRYSVTAGFVDEHTRVVPMSDPVWIEIVASKTQR